MSMRAPLAETILSATALGSSYADLGSAVKIAGYGNLTLHVYNVSGAGSAVVKVFTAPVATTAPTATTSLHQYTDAAGAEIELTTLTTEYASHPLHGLSGNYLMVSGKYSSTASTATIYITGTADMG